MIHPLPEEFSAYLDGDLAPERSRLLERHVPECAECAQVLDELRRVVARAQALDDRPPRHDLWPGVASAIGAGGPRRSGRITLSWPALLAASVVLMLGSAGSVLLWQQSQSAPIVSTIDAVPADGGERPAGAVSDRGYDGAVRALEEELRINRGYLDTMTVRVLSEKLALIDRAIREAERALLADPANGYLAGHLTQTRQRKLDLLRRAAMLNRAVS